MKIAKTAPTRNQTAILFHEKKEGEETDCAVLAAKSACVAAAPCAAVAVADTSAVLSAISIGAASLAAIGSMPAELRERALKNMLDDWFMMAITAVAASVMMPRGNRRLSFFMNPSSVVAGAMIISLFASL